MINTISIPAAAKKKNELHKKKALINSYLCMRGEPDADPAEMSKVDYIFEYLVGAAASEPPAEQAFIEAVNQLLLVDPQNHRFCEKHDRNANYRNS